VTAETRQSDILCTCCALWPLLLESDEYLAFCSYEEVLLGHLVGMEMNCLPGCSAKSLLRYLFVRIPLSVCVCSQSINVNI